MTEYGFLPLVKSEGIFEIIVIIPCLSRFRVAERIEGDLNGVTRPESCGARSVFNIILLVYFDPEIDTVFIPGRLGVCGDFLRLEMKMLLEQDTNNVTRSPPVNEESGKR